MSLNVLSYIDSSNNMIYRTSPCEPDKEIAGRSTILAFDFNVKRYDELMATADYLDQTLLVFHEVVKQLLNLGDLQDTLTSLFLLYFNLAFIFSSHEFGNLEFFKLAVC